MFLMNKNSFIKRIVNGVPFYSCVLLDELPGLRHGFSTRHGGVSAPPGNTLNLGDVSWDTPARVQENRQRLLRALEIPQGRLITLHQIHSERVHIIRKAPEQWDRPEGDAIITDVAGAALAIQTADCTPILIADPGTRTVAAVHSGWKGTLARLLLKAVESMCSALGCDVRRLVVAVGPSIRSCCYEVGGDVADMYRAQYPGVPLAQECAHRPGKYMLDLLCALQVQIEEAGIPASNLHDLGACTLCRNDEFFSYRAEGKHSGRMMAVIAKLG
jgi:YfiH family protein